MQALGFCRVSFRFTTPLQNPGPNKSNFYDKMLSQSQNEYIKGVRRKAEFSVCQIYKQSLLKRDNYTKSKPAVLTDT